MYWLTEEQLQALEKVGLRRVRRAQIAKEIRGQCFASEIVQISRIALHQNGRNIDRAQEIQQAAPPPEYLNAEPILVRPRRIT